MILSQEKPYIAFKVKLLLNYPPEGENKRGLKKWQINNL